MFRKTLVFLILSAVSATYHAATLCSYTKRVDLNNFQQLPADELNVFIAMDNLPKPSLTPHAPVSINSRLTLAQDIETSLPANPHSFADLFHFNLDPGYSDVKLSFARPDLIAEKTFNFQLHPLDDTQACNLTVDFYLSHTSDYFTALAASLNAIALDETMISHEAISESDLVEASLDLKSFLPEWSANRYQIQCLKCEANLKVSVAGSLLVITGRSVANGSLVFQDVVVQLDQYTGEEQVDRRLINVRLYSGRGKSREEERVKRYTGEKRVRMTQQQQGAANALKLAISEETVGVQTKLQVYDHEWSDYQVNASEYVRERIRVVAGQNLLNITEPFDFEEGGGMHTFQIVFKRNSNKRPSMCCGKVFFSFEAILKKTYRRQRKLISLMNVIHVSPNELFA